MKFRPYFLALFTLSLMAHRATAGDPLTAVEFEYAIKQANADWVKFAKVGDARSMAALYTPNAVIFPADKQPMASRKKIEGYYADLMKALGGSLETSFSSKSLQITQGMAFEVGQYTSERGGSKLQSYVVWKAVWDGEKWVARFHFDAWLSVPNAPEASFAPFSPAAVPSHDPRSLSIRSEARAAELHRPQLDLHEKRPPPRIPDKWTATALMAPFTAEQLVVGRFECDHRKKVGRARLFGTEYGSLEIFLTSHGAYRLLPSGEFLSIGPADWKTWPRDWLGPETPTFVGFAELFHGSFLAENMEWWKAPVPGSEAVKWIWFADRDPKWGAIPRRTMFAGENTSLAIIGSFATTYFLEFKPAPELELDVPHQVSKMPPGPINLLDLLQKSHSESAEDARRSALQAYAPGVRFEFDSEPALPIWPRQFGMTTFMTPVRANVDPRSTEVWYDYANDRQRTRMYHPSESSIAYEDALLLGTTGHHIQYFRDKKLLPQSANVLPGIPRPGWAPDDRAEVKAIISSLSDGRKASSEDGNVIIIQAPMVDPRIFWTWYTQRGRPLMFLETSAPADVGTGLALADYYDWKPGATTTDSAYALPRDVKLERSLFDGGFMHSSFKRQINFTDGQWTSLNPQSCYHCHRGPN